MAILGNTKITNLTLLDGVVGNLNPVETGVYDLGTSSLKWRMLYGNVTGDLTGNASSATKLKNGRTFQIKDADNTNAGTASSAFTGESNLIINLPSTIKATLSGNAATATKFASAQSITLTGDITGTVSSQAGWSIATTIGQNKVTNNMLAGSITNAKLSNSKVTIAGNDVSLGGSITADTLRTSLGLSNAMHFIGVTSTALTDGATTATLTAKTTGSLTKTTGFVAGDVVIDTNSSYEYVWTGAAWERLGPDGSYKITQTAYTNSTGTSESTTATRFVYSVSQDANGVVSFKTRPLPTYTNNAGTVTKVTAGTGLSIGTTAGGNFTTSGTINHTNSVTAQTTQALYPIKIDAQGHISAYGTAVTSLPASDVSAWAKAATKPTYAWNEITQSGANSINEGTSDFTDNTELFSSYASNNGFADTNAVGVVYRRDAIHMYNYIKTKLAVTNNNINLSRNTETTIATIGGTAIKIKLPASDNTDAKVKQSATTTANWRKVLLHYKDDAASTTAVTDSTNQAYATVGVSVQPSTNTLRAAAYNIFDKVTLQFNTATNALDFVFA